MDIANPQLKIRRKRKRLLLTGTLVLPDALRETRACVAVEYARHASRMPGEGPALLRAKGI